MFIRSLVLCQVGAKIAGLFFLFVFGCVEIANAININENVNPATSDKGTLTVSFTTDGTCANTPVSFFAHVSPAADRVQWSFGDGSTSNDWAPKHTYLNGSSFLVELTAYLGDEVAHAFGNINITASDLMLTLVQDTTACKCEFPANYSFCEGIINPFEVRAEVLGAVSAQLQWYGPGGILPGLTGDLLRPDSAGYYYLKATDVNGCTAYAGVNIKEYNSPDRRDDLWYFGNNAGIAFDSRYGTGTYAVSGPLNTPGGSSVISDRSRQLDLSTDGHQLWNGVGGWYDDITPANGLGGANTSTQSALIVPVQGDETLYYIFTTGKQNASEGSEIRYSVFDRKLNDGLGGLVVDNLLLFNNSTGRITGNASWIIVHEFGNNTFRAYKIRREGITQPVLSTIGSAHSGNVNPNGSGYMKLGGRNKLAVGVCHPGVANTVEVFDFNTTTGRLTNMTIADLEISSGQINGVEIFAGGNKIFATWTDGDVSRIYEFAPHVPTRYHLLQWVDHAGALGAIRYASDGRFYVAVNGSPTLTTFTAATDTAVVSNILPEPFALSPTTTSTLGLPNTVVDAPLAPSLSVLDACLGETTEFFATGKDVAIDKYDWSFGDGQIKIDSGSAVGHLYAAPGEYHVRLTIRNRCELPVASMVRTVSVRQPPANPSSTVVLCTGPVTLDANPLNAANLGFRWSTEEKTQTIEAHQQGIYGVTITDRYGCSTHSQIVVASHAPEVDLGKDLLLCEGAAIPALDAMNPGASFVWSINGVSNNNRSQIEKPESPSAGVFSYSVRVTDPITNCVGGDTVIYTIRERPQFTLLSNSPIPCTTNTGEISITVLPPTTTFDYEVSGPAHSFSGSGEASGSPVSTSATLSAGPYHVTVRDQDTGCESTDEVSIHGAIATPVISSDESLLFSSSDIGNQWFKDGTQILGATDKTYVVTQSGIYTVQVTIDECLAQSLPVTVIITGVENNRQAGISVFPNPSAGTVAIELEESSTDILVELLTVDGLNLKKMRLARPKNSRTSEIDLSEYPSGIYILKVRSGSVYRMIKVRKL